MSARGSRVLRVTILGDSSSAEKAMAATATGAAKLDVAIGGIGDGFKKAGAAAGALGAALTGAGIGVALKAVDAVASTLGKLKGSVIDTNAAMESSKQGWTILLGGAAAAEKQIQSLFTFAAQTPFEFGEVDKAARLLQTFGGAALNTTQNLTLVGDIAAAVDQPFSDVAMWVGRMYDAMQSGKPFGEAAARLQEMGALSGEARTKLEQLQKEGKKGPELWAEFNKTMGRFSGTMKLQAGTWQGLMSTVQDTIDQLAATAGKPIFDFAQKGLKRFADALSDPRVAAFAELIAGKLTQALNLVGRIIATAWPPLQRFLGGIISAGRAVLEATKAFRSGQTNLGQFIGGIENLVRTVRANLGHLKDLVGPPLAAFGRSLLDALKRITPQILAQLRTWGERFGDWVRETAWPALVAKLGELAGRLGAWLSGTALPAIRAKLAEWGAAFGGWVTETAWPALQKQLPELLASLGSWITETALPAIRERLNEWGPAFADWVTDTAVPQVKAKLGEWGNAIADYITNTALPRLTTEIGKLSGKLADWITSEETRNKFNEWVGTAATAVADMFKVLDEGGKENQKKLSDWIKKEETQQKFKELAIAVNEGGGEILTAISEFSANAGVDLNRWLNESGPRWLVSWTALWEVTNEQAGRIYQALQDWSDRWAAETAAWYETAGPAWLHDWGELWRVADEQAGKIAERMQRFSDDLGNALNGIGPKWLHDWGAAGDALHGAIDDLAASAGAWAQGVGTAIVDGVVAGLRAAWHLIVDELRRLASTLPGPVQSVLGISSPSRVFAAEVGAPIVEGILAGILARRPALDRGIADLVTVPGGVMSPGHNRGGDPANWRPFGSDALRDTGGPAALTVHLTINAPHLTDIGDRAQQRQLAGEAARRIWADITRGGPAGVR